MDKKVLDIWAVQQIKEELPVALDNIKHDDAIIFENAIVELIIGNKKIKDKIFNCIVYSEKSDTMVLVMKNAKVGIQDVEDFLQKKNIKYHFVSFLDKPSTSKKIKTPEIWFARDPYVVADACEDSLTKDIDKSYIFDRNKTAKLTFKFLTSNNTKAKFDIDIKFRGVINLKDKIILIVDDLNISKKHDEIEQILNDKDFHNYTNLSI